MKRYSVAIPVLVLFFTLASCHKELQPPPQPENILTLTEIKAKAGKVIAGLVKKPVLLFEESRQRIVGGKVYIRIPVQGDQAHFYFTRDNGDIKMIYVIAEKNLANLHQGIVGFMDPDTKSFTAVQYTDNKPTGVYSIKDPKAFFQEQFVTGTEAVKQKVMDACINQFRVIRMSDGRDTVVIRTLSDIPCPGDMTLMQKIKLALQSFFSAVSGAFDAMFGGGGSNPFTIWDFGMFYDYSEQWTPFESLSPADDYAATLGYAWEADSYDNNSTVNPPYDPVVDGPYDPQGYRKNGPSYQYVGGTVQNYTNDNGDKYAVFTSTGGVQTTFPGVTITDYMVLAGAGVTTANGGIHMSRIGNGLVDLQHEYGHYLQALELGSFNYFRKIVIFSVYSAKTDPAHHRYYWTEIDANKRSAVYFGPNSPIATDSSYPK